MSENGNFAEVVDAADRLSDDEQEQLIILLRRRLAERGRRQIIDDVRDAAREFDAGGCEQTTPDNLIREIES